MMVINKRLLRISHSIRRRLFGTFAIIALSVALMVSFPVSMRSVSERLDIFRRQNSVHDILIQTSVPLYDDTVSENTEVEKRYFIDADISDGKLLHIISMTKKIDKISVTKGDMIRNSGEVLIDSMFARSNNIDIGNLIDISGQNFTVAGFYAAPDSILPAKNSKSIMVSSDSYGLAVMSEDDIKKLGNCSEEYLIRLVKDDDYSLNQIICTIDEKYTITSCIKADEDNRVIYIDGDLKLFSGDLGILPVIFIIIASLTASAVVSRIMKAQAVQIGVFYALGYKTGRLYVHYMMYSLIVFAAGAVAGMVLGSAAAPLVAGILRSRYILPSFKMKVYPEVLLKAVCMPMIIMILICSVTVILILRRTPLELIRNEKSDSHLCGLTHIKFQRLPFSMRFIIRMFVRNLPRQIFLLLGTMLSSMLMLTYASMISSLSDELKDKAALILTGTSEYNSKAVEETILPLKILLVVLLVIAAVTAFIIIITVTSMVIEESSHTISLMKVLGYGEKHTAHLVVDESAFTVLDGYLLSIPLALKVSDTTFGFMSDTLGMDISAELDPLYCITGLVFVMTIFFFAKLLMQKKIFSVPAADAVKARE